jgi:hypothetical protein
LARAQLQRNTRPVGSARADPDGRSAGRLLHWSEPEALDGGAEVRRVHVRVSLQRDGRVRVSQDVLDLERRGAPLHEERCGRVRQLVERDLPNLGFGPELVTVRRAATGRCVRRRLALGAPWRVPVTLPSGVHASAADVKPALCHSRVRQRSPDDSGKVQRIAIQHLAAPLACHAREDILGGRRRDDGREVRPGDRPCPRPSAAPCWHC